MSITADQEKSALTNVNSQLFIGGEWREASGGATLDVEDPSTGETIASVADATPEDASAALDAERGAARRVAPLAAHDELRGGVGDDALLLVSGDAHATTVSVPSSSEIETSIE